MKKINRFALFTTAVCCGLIFFSMVRAADKPSFEVAPQAGPTLSNPTSVVSPTQVSQNGEVTFSARVTDVSGVESVFVDIKDSTSAVKARVTLFDDGLHSDGLKDDGTFTNKWNVGTTADGTYSIAVLMNDQLGNPSTASVGNLVIGTPPPPVDTTPPVVSITTPATDGTTVSTSSFTVVANAFDNESPIGAGGRGQVEFYLDAETAPRDTQYSDSPDGSNDFSSLFLDSVGNGDHTIKVVATNGSVSPLTTTVTRTVTISRASTPPTVTITSPVNRAVISGLVDVSITATDNVSVNEVRLYEATDGNIGTATPTPAATVNVVITWDATATATTFNNGFYFPYADNLHEQEHFSLIPRAEAAELAADENTNCFTSTSNVAQLIYAVAMDNESTAGTSGYLVTYTPVTTTSCTGGTNSGTPL